MNAKRIADEAVVILAAVAAPVDALLVHVRTFDSTTGTLVGGIVAAFVAAWRGQDVLTARANSAPPVAPSGELI